jgi:hypothetical protein
MPILNRRHPALRDVVGWIGLEEEVFDTIVAVGVLLPRLVVSCDGLIEDGLCI